MPLELRYDISRADAAHAFVSLFQIYSEVQAQSVVTRNPEDVASERAQGLEPLRQQPQQ